MKRILSSSEVTSLVLPLFFPPLLQLTDLRKLMLFFAAAHKFEACVHLMTTLLQYDPFIELMSFNYCLRAVTGHMISTGTSLDVVLQLSKKLASTSGQASVNSQHDLMLVFYKKGDLGKRDAVGYIAPSATTYQYHLSSSSPNLQLLVQLTCCLLLNCVFCTRK